MRERERENRRSRRCGRFQEKRGLLQMVDDASVSARGVGISVVTLASVLGIVKDWIELLIRNEKILSPDSDIKFSRNFHNFLQLSCNSQRILTFSHTSLKFREN